MRPERDLRSAESLEVWMRNRAFGMAVKPIDAKTYRLVVHAMACAVTPRVIVEVGVFDGLLSRLLADIHGVERLFVIDPWAEYKRFSQERMDQVAASVISWASTKPNVEVLRMKSSDAMSLVDDNSVDFFHTDGDHSTKGIRADIIGWLPKIRPGGLITGDNYEYDLIANAVNELLPQRQSAGLGRVWWSRKPDETN